MVRQLLLAPAAVVASTTGAIADVLGMMAQTHRAKSLAGPRA